MGRRYTGTSSRDYGKSLLSEPENLERRISYTWKWASAGGCDIERTRKMCNYSRPIFPEDNITRAGERGLESSQIRASGVSIPTYGRRSVKVGLS